MPGVSARVGGKSGGGNMLDGESIVGNHEGWWARGCLAGANQETARAVLAVAGQGSWTVFSPA